MKFLLPLLVALSISHSAYGDSKSCAICWEEPGKDPGDCATECDNVEESDSACYQCVGSGATDCATTGKCTQAQIDEYNANVSVTATEGEDAELTGGVVTGADVNPNVDGDGVDPVNPNIPDPLSSGSDAECASCLEKSGNDPADCVSVCDDGQTGGGGSGAATAFASVGTIVALMLATLIE